MSESLSTPSPEDLSELRARGVVFASPLVVRLAVSAALASTVLFLADRGAPLEPQVDLAGLSRMCIAALSTFSLLAAVTIFVTTAVSLTLNGFFISAQILPLRRRQRARRGIVSSLAVVGLGLVVGVIGFYAAARTLFGLLYLMGDPGQGLAAILDGLAAIGQRVAIGIIVGSLFLAILAGGVARFGFLLRHRVAKIS
jgi:hypothetical protein